MMRNWISLQVEGRRNSCASAQARCVTSFCPAAGPRSRLARITDSLASNPDGALPNMLRATAPTPCNSPRYDTRFR
jgi:hypothetical protein